MRRQSNGSSPIPRPFEIIVYRHYDNVYRFATRSVGTDAGADLAQEVFLIAFSQRRRFRTDRESARPWLLGIATNLVRRWYRSEGRRRRLLLRWVQPGRSADFTADADDRLSALSVRRQLRTALRAVPDQERDVLLLFALADLSYEEIGVTLAVPLGTVKSRLHRGRHRLRRILEEDAAAIIGQREAQDRDA